MIGQENTCFWNLLFQKVSSCTSLHLTGFQLETVDTWECLEIFFIAVSWRGSEYHWHLKVRRLGCCYVGHTTQDSSLSTVKHYLAQMSVVQLERGDSLREENILQNPTLTLRVMLRMDLGREVSSGAEQSG